MNTIRKAFLAMLLLWSITGMASVTFNISGCTNGNFIFTGSHNLFIGFPKNWTLYKDNVVIDQVNGVSSYSKSFPASSISSGAYKLRVSFYTNGSWLIETSPIKNFTHTSTEYVNLAFTPGESYFNFCPHPDPDSTSLNIFVQQNKWTSGTCNIYSTTEFGGAKGSLIQSSTLFLGLGFFFPDRASFFHPGDYILIEMDVTNTCRSGSRTIYLFGSSNCRVGDDLLSFDATSTSLDFYPNPVESSIQLKRDLSEFIKVELYSSQGILIEDITGSGTSIDFSDKQTGLYYLKAYEIDGSVKMSKVTKN